MTAAKPRRVMKRPEQVLQLSVARFLAVALGQDVLWFHPPNGGARSKVEAGIFAGMGVQRGVPDLVFVFGGRAAFIELKASKGRVSDEQAAWGRKAEGVGALFAVCRTIEEVEATLRGWGVPLKARFT